MDVEMKGRVVFDPIYGFIKLTPVEYEIIHSPFYQRLRWIKQLGFSCYVFPGAEHSRFGHSIGVMFNAHKILQSIERGVSDSDLMDPSCLTKEAIYHKSLRIGALLHDLGTFVFSHTTEAAYITFGETTNTKGGKGLKDDHENLGSFIIKNTDYEGGITHILKKYGLDPQTISDLVKGVDPSILANQILHSEIDCDRMDYLLRDAHYTGLKYGAYDRDYLLHHFEVRTVEKHDILAIRHNALHCVEDFLMSRFAWYSQVIRSPRGSKYDAIAERLTFHFLEKGYIYRYSDLLDMISNEPMKFYGFNDSYFINLVQKHLANGDLDSVPDIKDMAMTLLLEKGAKTIRCHEFKQILFDQDRVSDNEKIVKKAQQKVKELQDYLTKNGSSKDWILPDLPKKDIIYVKSPKAIAKGGTTANLLLERDPVKISYENGDIKLLADVENSVISSLHKKMNYTPNVFCSESAHKILVDAGLIES
ncbi:HD domain-containing protein [Halobacteriovorax sp. HLS]|uniref:HD domain-containing protein n=1 Tax=Halobacteriovorax sp. HLS TaxID=2234000 RepID=UPI000FD97AE8|nr:HD domain-containing protein [Halobacteriovorax sp. HLS]